MRMQRDPSTLPTRADARANRSALIAAAIELFSRHGPHVPYEDVAAAAGVGRATLYRNFATREDLLAAILESLLADLEATAAQLTPGPDRFAELFDACIRAQEQVLPLLELATRATPRDQLQHTRRRFEAIFREPLAEARGAGRVPPDTTVRDVRLILNMLSAVLGPTVSRSDRRRAIELARRQLIADTGVASTLKRRW